ncbi:type 2 periplasmic-binding domain-containing protein [Desertihabitans aurantiacus]|uniref:extracellular solute-binding protein n=1 Tax=Desertihabitans aurantiacus TaxID=2282477 RepID=UPI000DF743C6|nr:extracellular solute-binding protein [Desertihabitans aurantiacus]
MTPTSPVSRRRLLQGGLTAAALSALGVPTLTGCSNEGRGGGGSQAANDAVRLPDYLPYQGVEPDLAGRDGVSDAMLAYPADPVRATDTAPGDGRPVSVLTISNTPLPPALDNNTFWQALNERLGFELSVSLVPSGDFDERFQTAVAGSQLPDVFSLFTGSIPSLPALLQSEAVDLTPLLAGSAAANYPFLANIPTESWRSTVFGGKIYGVPIPRGPQSSAMLYARADLMEGRGITAAPGSLQELHDLCTEVTASAGNTWALGGVPLQVLRQMHGVPNAWSEQGGTLTSANEAEGQQDALEAGRRLVADGLVHPDAFGAPGTQRKTWLVNGSISLMEDTFSAWPDFYTFPIGEEFRLTVYPPALAGGGGTAPIWLAGPTHNITAINLRAADRAEALLGVLDHLAAPFGTAEHLFKNYGLPGEHHELDGTDPVLTERGRSETQLGLKYIAEGPWTTYQAGRPEVVQARFDAQTAVVPGALRNPVLGLYSETASRRGSQIGSVLGNLEADILQGRRPVSAWAEGVATWKKNGGDTIRDEYQQALQERVGG